MLFLFVEIAMDDVGYTTNRVLYVYIMQDPDQLYSQPITFAVQFCTKCHAVLPLVRWMD